MCIKLVDWHPVVIAGGRSFIAALFMMGARWLSPEKRRRPFDLRPLWPAGLAYAATMILFVIANKLTASANAILLQYSAPVWAAILGWFLLGEKLRREQWGALGLAMGGVVLFFKDGLASGSLAGDSIALVSGMAFGVNSVLMRMQREGTPEDSFILAHLVTAVFSVPLLFPSSGHEPQGRGGYPLFGGISDWRCFTALCLRHRPDHRGPGHDHRHDGAGP